MSNERGKNDRNSKPERALLDLIVELEPYGNKAIKLGPFALPMFTLRHHKIMSLITGIRVCWYNL